MAEWENVLGSGISKTASPNVAPRKELRDLTKEERYLFAEGLARFQQKDLEKEHQSPDSYYEIAGIHGLPYRRWPDEDWNKDMSADPVKGAPGFCTHTSILFLTWHRPFLALFESKLWENVQSIAKGISPSDGQDRYLAAAKTFRLPYWDWARVDRFIFPAEALDQKQIWWSGPNSKNSVWPSSGKYNPLHQAPLPANADQGILNYGNPTRRQNRGESALSDRDRDNSMWDRVKRVQTQHSGATIYAQDVVAARNLSERVANLLGGYQRFAPISSNAFSFDQSKAQRTARKEVWGSLEDVHNAIHDLVGNGGHMGQISASAFDPIFWLHHCNIDRLFALWQGLREDKGKADTWVTDHEFTARSTTYLKTSGAAGPDGDKTELYPFKYLDDNNNLQWYTSAQTHNVEDFNYTYPELQGLHGLALDQRRSKIVPAIGKLYPQPADDIAASFLKNPRAGERMVPVARMMRTMKEENISATAESAFDLVAELPEPEKLLEESLQPEKPFLRDLAPDGKYFDWIVNIKGEKHALDGKYAVYVFMDAVEENDVSLWPLSPHFVGVFAPLGQDGNTACSKCKEGQAEKLEVTGQIPLTIALMERYLAQIIPDITADTVVPYLQKNLHWRVAVDKQALDDRSQVPSLTVFVISNEVTVTEPLDELPIFADDVTIHAEATTNRDGSGRGNGTGLAVGEDGTERTTSG
ncbi:hypothetical protein CBER1_06201 [Cercospora berteroae]|uniref:tyrosinase n=1 Tax=Cercospora berteroae TaxID=357750 RepID=A0A2S6CMG2_9PEZI|nr:hypothetical protein CBER1_06201 [Cercospora berteroae]